MQFSSDVVLMLHYFYMMRGAWMRSHPKKLTNKESKKIILVLQRNRMCGWLQWNIKTDILFSLIVTVEFCHSCVNKYFVDSLFIYVIKKQQKATCLKNEKKRKKRKENPKNEIGQQGTKFGRSECNTFKENVIDMSNGWICDIIAD